MKALEDKILKEGTVLPGNVLKVGSFLNQQIEILQENGFRVSMDDFGSGYSTLNMLYQLRIDELKLDRGFLKKASVDDEKRRNIILE